MIVMTKRQGLWARPGRRDISIAIHVSFGVPMWHLSQAGSLQQLHILQEWILIRWFGGSAMDTWISDARVSGTHEKRRPEEEVLGVQVLLAVASCGIRNPCRIDMGSYHDGPFLCGPKEAVQVAYGRPRYPLIAIGESGVCQCASHSRQ